jgi:hypothetical protein
VMRVATARRPQQPQRQQQHSEQRTVQRDCHATRRTTHRTAHSPYASTTTFRVGAEDARDMAVGSISGSAAAGATADGARCVVVICGVAAPRSAAGTASEAGTNDGDCRSSRPSSRAAGTAVIWTAAEWEHSTPQYSTRRWEGQQWPVTSECGAGRVPRTGSALFLCVFVIVSAQHDDRLIGNGRHIVRDFGLLKCAQLLLNRFVVDGGQLSAQQLTHFLLTAQYATAQHSTAQGSRRGCERGCRC